MTAAKRAATYVSLLAVLAIAGCSASGGLSVFDSARTAQDELPASVTDAITSVISDTSVLLWKDGTDAVYAVKSSESGAVCLLVTGSDVENSTAACGSVPLTITTPGGTKFLLTDLAPNKEDGWEQKAENLWMKR